LRLASPFLRTPEKGAEGVIHLCTSPKIEGISGKYWMDGREHRASAGSQDVDAAEKLWAISAQMCGLAL
jgi:hypothetical protein